MADSSYIVGVLLSKEKVDRDNKGAYYKITVAREMGYWAEIKKIYVFNEQPCKALDEIAEGSTVGITGEAKKYFVAISVQIITLIPCESCALPLKETDGKRVPCQCSDLSSSSITFSLRIKGTYTLAERAPSRTGKGFLVVFFREDVIFRFVIFEDQWLYNSLMGLALGKEINLSGWKSGTHVVITSIDEVNI